MINSFKNTLVGRHYVFSSPLVNDYSALSLSDSPKYYDLQTHSLPAIFVSYGLHNKTTTNWVSLNSRSVFSQSPGNGSTRCWHRHTLARLQDRVFPCLLCFWRLLAILGISWLVDIPLQFLSLPLHGVLFLCCLCSYIILVSVSNFPFFIRIAVIGLGPALPQYDLMIKRDCIYKNPIPKN